MTVGSKICPRCRAVIPSAAHLCKNCGHRFSEAELASSQTARNPSSRLIPILGVVAVAIAIWATGGAHKNEKTPEVPEEATVAPSVSKSEEKYASAPKTGASGPSASSEPSAPPEGKYADQGRQAIWIAKSQEGVTARLKDPDSADFRNVRFYSGSGRPMVCGEVNAKNGFGGYTGFERFIASGDRIVVLASDMKSSGEMAKAWRELCVRASADAE